MTESYDPDEDRRSPGLEATKPDYKPHKDPTPPFIVKEAKEPEGEFKYSSGEGTPDGSRKPQSNLYKPETNEGNSVLISYIDPNRPDIANYERSDPLRPEHLRDILCDDLLDKPIIKPEKPKLESPVVEPAKPREPQSETDPSEAAKRALALLDLPKPSDDPLEPPEIPVKSHIPSPDARAGVKTEILSPKISQPPPPALPSITEKKPFSPPLRQYAISVHQSQDVLPPFHSPDNTTTLPPIQTALRGIAHVNEPAVRVNGSSPYSLPPVTASSPPGLRSDPVWEHQRPGHFVPPQIPPSPYSHLSPASTKDLSAVSSPAAQSSYWRPQKSDIPYITSAYDIAHCEAKSPATSYPTPTDQTPAGTCERTPYNPSPQHNGVVTSGAYKCRHPGCTAPPFQTQYLLNSHANVHSQDRPHFCPIEGCPRGIGGKGFKRKNEMIRHGLVHNSPGYVCPFCPDQQHKYPRPDNLQRHVRVHHVDKSKDDPQLRLVLSQRPEGSARGRRRRINS